MNKSAIWSLILVFVQILLSVISSQIKGDIVIVFAVTSLVFLGYSAILGVRALREIKKTNEKGKSAAIVALCFDIFKFLALTLVVLNSI